MYKYDGGYENIVKSLQSTYSHIEITFVVHEIRFSKTHSEVLGFLEKTTKTGQPTPRI